MEITVSDILNCTLYSAALYAAILWHKKMATRKRGRAASDSPTLHLVGKAQKKMT
jgi:hypothetical protein